MGKAAKGSSEPVARLTGDELARLAGISRERLEALTARRVVVADAGGTYPAGDAHRIRVVEGFEAAGVPLDVLVRAQDAGLVTVAYYDELHPPPGRPSGRTYAAFRASLGEAGELLPSVLGAFGLAEPDPTSVLAVEDEAFLEQVLVLVTDTGQADLMLRVLRQFGEATRRAAVASLEVYGEVIERLDPAFAGVPPRHVFERLFQPWARVARALPDIAEWLTSKHVSREIDAYSIDSTEQMLEESGFVPGRPDVEPAVVFLDLTGFTALARERGDATAADVALRLADLATATALSSGGRVVKLLGDGVLMRYPDVALAVDTSLGLLEALVASDLPAGHVGIAEGPVIARDGDIFGRTVNLAARISDVAPSGRLYLPQSSARALADRFVVEPVGRVELPGLGAVELAEASRPGGPPGAGDSPGAREASPGSAAI